MNLTKLEKKRTKLLRQMRAIATELNESILPERRQVEVYFSGRDEELIVILLKSEKTIIQIDIQLSNHLYDITGNERITISLREPSKNPRPSVDLESDMQQKIEQLVTVKLKSMMEPRLK